MCRLGTVAALLGHTVVVLTVPMATLSTTEASAWISLPLSSSSRQKRHQHTATSFGLPHCSDERQQRRPWVLSLHVSAFGSRTPLIRPSAGSKDDNDNDAVGDNTSILRLQNLAIFPLSKKVRLPTERLTLNLYEERYLQMSDYIMHHLESKLFGALYTANKPHIVPILSPESDDSMIPVPMIECGDVGVLCVLDDYNDSRNSSSIYSNSMNETLDKTTMSRQETHRRIVRLDATLSMRFSIEQIVHTGYYTTSSTTDSSTSGSSKQQQQPQQVPYIVANVRLLLNEQNHDKDGAATTESSSGSSMDYHDLASRTLRHAERLAGTTCSPSAEATSLSSSPSLSAGGEIQYLLALELQTFARAAATLPETATLERLECLLSPK